MDGDLPRKLIAKQNGLTEAEVGSFSRLALRPVRPGFFNRCAPRSLGASVEAKNIGRNERDQSIFLSYLFDKKKIKSIMCGIFLSGFSESCFGKLIGVGS